MMNETWIVVAHRSGAEIYQANASKRVPKLLESIDHPKGRLKAGEINTDGPGHTFQSASPGQHRLVPAQRATQRVAQDFARTIAEELNNKRKQNRFDSLILVAPPRFLGRLREALPAAMHSMVIGTLDKDLSGAEPDELQQQIEAIEYENGS